MSDELNRRYDPMSRAELIATCERYRAALMRLNDGWKYSTEVVTIAREALSEYEFPHEGAP